MTWRREGDRGFSEIFGICQFYDKQVLEITLETFYYSNQILYIKQMSLFFALHLCTVCKNAFLNVPLRTDEKVNVRKAKYFFVAEIFFWPLF